MMSEEKQCPECGNFIPEEIPFGLCPACCMRSLSSERGALNVGEIKGIEIIKELGRGAFGRVYQAVETEGAERLVALKILDIETLSQPTIDRFQQEIQNVSQLEHTHIARFYHAGLTADGSPYYAMEYVDGCELSDWSKDASDDEKLAALIQISSAITYAHQHGIAHRDLKPTNILITQNDDGVSTKLIDFGISRAFHGTEKWARESTMVGQRMGTPLYMSPEQLEGSQNVDLRTDIWSMGLLLYEMFLGKPLLENVISSSQSWTENSLSLKEMVLPKLTDRELEWIGRKACAIQPADRYQSSYAMNKDLNAKSNNEAVSVGMAYWGYRVKKYMSKNKLLVILIAAASVCFTTFAISGWVISQREKKTNHYVNTLLEQEKRARQQAEKTNEQLKKESSDTALLAGVRSLFAEDYTLAKQQIARSIALWEKNITAHYVSSVLRGTLPEAKKLNGVLGNLTVTEVMPHQQGFAVRFENGDLTYIDSEGKCSSISQFPLKPAREKNTHIMLRKDKVGSLGFLDRATGLPLLHPLIYGSGSEKAYYNSASMRVLVVGEINSLWDVSAATRSMQTTRTDHVPIWAGLEKKKSIAWVIDTEKNLYQWDDGGELKSSLRMIFLNPEYDRWKAGEGHAIDMGDATTGLKGVLQLCAWKQWVVGNKHHLTTVVRARECTHQLVSTSNGKVFYQQPKEFYDHILGVTSNVEYLAVEAYARIAAAACKNNQIYVIDLATKKAIHQWEMHSPATSITIPDGGKDIVIGHQDGTISIREINTGNLRVPLIRLTKSLPKDRRIHLKTRPGKAEVLCCYDGNVELRRLSTKNGKWLGKPMRHSFGVDWFCVSNNGEILFSCDQSGKGPSRLRIWSLRLGLEILPSIQHPDQITWVTIIEGGKRMITCCGDKVVRRWFYKD